MRRAALLAAVFLAVTPWQAMAQVPASELARSVDIPFEEFTLDNGLRVIVHTDRKAPVVAIHAWYNVGSKDEPQGQTGYAHLFEHIGLFNPTENVPGGLMEPLRAMGATDWNGTTWFDRTNFFQTVPTSAVEQALYMESDRMGHLLGALSQERLDNQRGVVQNEKRQGDNQPYGLVYYTVLETLFPEGHPYRHSTIGSMADLDAASLEDLRQWHRDNYGPNNAVLVLAGDIDVPTARTLVNRYFGHIPRGAQNEPAQAYIPTLPARVDKLLHDRVPNTQLSRTWVVPGLLSEEAASLDIAASIFGGLASSRLDNALVRGEETATSVSSSYQPFQRLGMFDLDVNVKPGGDADAVSARLDQLLADYIANGPTQAEVERAVTRRISQTLQALEPTGGFSGKAVTLAEGELYADDPGFYRRQLAAYGAVTPASVKAAMQRWLSRPTLAIRVEPGEREAYVEAADNRPPPAPAQPLPITPRAPMPAVGEMRPLVFPTTERMRLSNGIEVIYLRSTTVPITRVAVEFNAGLAADPADELGTQSLMLGLLKEAAGDRDAAQIAEREEQLGASVSAGASMDRTVVSLTSPSANLDPSLALLGDIIRRPAFRPADIERRRAQQLASIAQERSSPNGMAARAWPALVYGADHPYGRPMTGLGSPETVGAISREDLLAFHANWIRPDTAQIFVVSDKPLSEVAALLDTHLGHWVPSATPPGVKNFDAAIPAAQPRIVLVDRPQSPQSIIIGAMVLPTTGHQDRVIFNAANEAIGSGFLSRINQDIRETRGWSYGLSGSAAGLEQQVPYVISAPVQSNRTGESVQVLMDQYRAFLGERGVSPAERERIVNANVRQLPGQFETSAALLGALRSMALYGRPDDYWTTLAPRYQGLDQAALDAEARRLLGQAPFVWVIVGDAATVRPQLEALGLPVEVRAAQ
ncbi:M16 family metallopeptidase [Brevundimonas sp.]|uniref:M16 family metallopeptidase n=1 Tax=Brevundimonas sp. TaxID=1871086 RepID=UPI003F6F57D1